MTKRRKSPVWLDCENLDVGFDNEKLCAWKCDEARVGAVELDQMVRKPRDRRGDSKKFTAILHRSTKPDHGTYPWQVSYFTDGVPTGDSSAKSCAKALNDDLHHSVWRLRNVASKR